MVHTDKFKYSHKIKNELINRIKILEMYIDVIFTIFIYQSTRLCIKI